MTQMCTGERDAANMAASGGRFPRTPGERVRSSFSYPAVPETVRCARDRLAAIAEHAGAHPEQAERVRLAVSEIVTNAIVHAYGGDASGEIRVSSTVIGGELLIAIADEGCGLGASEGPSGLGMGMSLAERVSDGLSVASRASGGVEVLMRFGLGAPAPTAETPAAP